MRYSNSAFPYRPVESELATRGTEHGFEFLPRVDKFYREVDRRDTHLLLNFPDGTYQTRTDLPTGENWVEAGFG